MGIGREKARGRLPDYSPRAAVYCRVSTTGQTPENQVDALRAFAAARGWTVTEFVDHGVSGAKDRRPALDSLLAGMPRHFVALACNG